MILRSRKLPARAPPKPTTPGTLRHVSTEVSPRTPPFGLKLQRVKKRVSSLCACSDEEMPQVPVKRASRWAKNKRKRSEEVTDLEEMNPRRRPGRVHFQMDEQLQRRPVLNSIYSPVIDFLSPQSQGPTCCSPPMQKVRRQCPKAEDVPYFSELPIDTKDDAFNRYQFMCRLPPPSDNPRMKRKDIPFKTRSAPVNTLVLDLDETLVRCSLSPSEDTEFTFLILFQDIYYKVFMKLRPHVKEFLEILSKMYEMFVFTTAKRDYAEKVLEVLDPRRRLIRHRLYQEDCTCFLGHYIKNLNVLQRDLAKTVILDNSVHTCPYQTTNRIPVKSFLGDDGDEELLHLIPLLEELTHVEDVRTEISRRYHRKELLSEY